MTEAFLEKQREWELAAAKALRQGDLREYTAKTVFYYALWKLHSERSATDMEQYLIRSQSNSGVAADRIRAVFDRLNGRLALQYRSCFENLQSDGSAALNNRHRSGSAITTGQGVNASNNDSSKADKAGPELYSVEWFLEHPEYGKAMRYLYRGIQFKIGRERSRAQMHELYASARASGMTGDQLFRMLQNGAETENNLGLQ